METGTLLEREIVVGDELNEDGSLRAVHESSRRVWGTTDRTGESRVVSDEVLESGRPKKISMGLAGVLGGVLWG